MAYILTTGEIPVFFYCWEILLLRNFVVGKFYVRPQQRPGSVKPPNAPCPRTNGPGAARELHLCPDKGAVPRKRAPGRTNVRQGAASGGCQVNVKELGKPSVKRTVKELLSSRCKEVPRSCIANFCS